MESQENLLNEVELEEDYPKLLYSTNKLATDRSFIIRTVEPRFIAEVFLFTDQQRADNFMRHQRQPYDSTTIKKRTVVVVVKEFWDDPANFEPRIIRLATKKLASWYKAQFLESIKRLNSRSQEYRDKKSENYN
ncbi:hypothetical protein EDD80_105181 [Anseongella ginsenosidimutans]|uniref:Uncharacterized protein n=1 Tax=Anseongella ginsenosidimutans TaxID=496056 RepID=A0A4R3KS77_9SPHI|nr:hypothetical protein [Anseongella ginsenosidimutans]QEC52965.1 hypothetical protein FRZ59_11890 [Anseongella ginsenosidimutans]TCS87367.1 hypothetical protein EDD80_105181 [Anseongella ginsenosidimutans]